MIFIIVLVAAIIVISFLTHLKDYNLKKVKIIKRCVLQSQTIILDHTSHSVRAAGVNDDSVLLVALSGSPALLFPP